MTGNRNSNNRPENTDFDGTRKPIRTPSPHPTNPGYDENVDDKRSPNQENPGQRR